MNANVPPPRFLIPLAVLVFTIAGCATDRQVIDQANDVHTELEPAVLEDPELSTYLQTVGDRIVKAAEEHDPKRFQDQDNQWMFSDEEFHLVNSKTLNAFTTGGTHMYIYSELMQQCTSEDELAAVMSHEYAHVYARHVHKGINRQYAIIGGAAVVGAAGYAAGGEEHGEEYAKAGLALGLVAGQFLGMGYTRDDEAEADKLGFMFYTRAGWDPDRFADFFQHMIDKGYDTTPEAMSDHPTLASRVAAAQKRAANLKPEAKAWRAPPVADDAKFAALKVRVAELGVTAPSDESLKNAQTLLSAVPSCLLPVDQPEQKEAQQRLRQALEQVHKDSR